MKQKKLGRTDLKVSEIGFGAWAIGGSWGTQKEEDSLAALNRALDLGVNFIDTAAGYGDGRSERIIGKVLKEREEQDRVIVTTKTPPAPGPWPPSPYCRWQDRYSEKYLRENVEERLRNLATDHLDVLLLHTWTRAWNREPKPLEFLKALQKEGKIRYFGISTPEHDQNALVELMKRGWVDAVEVIYNIFEQEPAAELLPVAAENNVGVIARMPFDESALTGKLTEQTRFEEGDFRNKYFMGDRLKRTVKEVEKVQEDIAGSGYTLPQAALKFQLAHPAVSTSIPGMRNVQQVEANLAVSEMPDMPEEMIKLLQKHNWRRAFWYEGR
ncbi:MAG: aldo/keto reductase [Spirochaetaceae bacterium]|nr:MAG: aldo/keto reductase [Spirochaetaceae bacterium]